LIDKYRKTACANRSNFVVLEIIKSICYEHRQNGIYRMDGTYNGTFRYFERIRPKHQERTAQHRRRGITGQPRPAPHAENQPPFPATIPFHGQATILYHQRKAVLQTIGRTPVH